MPLMPVFTVLARRGARRGAVAAATVALLSGPLVVLPGSVAAAAVTASFTADPAYPYVGEQVTLSDTSSGKVAAESWDLDGDGTYGDATGSTVTTSFKTAGGHTIGLQVVESGTKQTFTASRQLEVIDHPAAAFSRDVESPVTGQQITFTSTSTGKLKDWSWDLNGDGTYGDALGRQASKRFTKAGVHTVGLQVTDVRGTVSTATADVSVSQAAPPTAVLAVRGGSVRAGKPVTLTAAGSTPGSNAHIVNYRWDFTGTGHAFHTSTGTDPEAHHTFGPGDHAVAVQVVDSNQATATQILHVRSDAPPGCSTLRNISTLLVATASCIRENNGVYTLTPGSSPGVIGRELNIDGLTFRTTRPDNDITIDTHARTLRSAGPYQILLENTPIGDIDLYGVNDHLDWSFGSGHGSADGIIRLATVGAGQGCDASQSRTVCAQVPGDFPLQGLIDLSIDTSDDDIVVQANVGLHQPMEVSGRVRIRADLFDGIFLDQLGFRVANAHYGAFTLNNLDFEYEAPGTGDPEHDGEQWSASVELMVNGLHASGKLVFINGQFNFGSVDIRLPNGTGIPIYAGVLLNRFAGAFGVHPLRIGGGIGLNIEEVLQIDGNFLYTKRDDGITIIHVDGSAEFNDQPIANVYFDNYSDGYTDFGAQITYQYPYPSNNPDFKIDGGISFWIEDQGGGKSLYEGQGRVNLVIEGVGPFGGQALINNQWIAGCLHYDPFGIKAAHNQVTGRNDYGLGCDLSPYQIAPIRHTSSAVAAARGIAPRAAADSQSFTVPTGLTAMALTVDGNGGVPDVTLTSPDGTSYTPPTSTGIDHDGRYYGLAAPDNDQVLVRVQQPASGTWTVTPNAGSVDLTGVHIAHALPAVQITTKVTGHGRARTMTWHATGLAGRQVRFLERSGTVTDTIAVTKRAAGKATFTLQDGAAGKRAIEADIATAGQPATTMIVGHFTAPAPARPGRPGKLKFARHGLKVGVSWPKLRGATGYVATIRGSDGRHELRVTRGSNRVTVSDVQPSATLTVAVKAYTQTESMTGPARNGSLHRVPARHHKRRHQHHHRRRRH